MAYFLMSILVSIMGAAGLAGGLLFWDINKLRASLYGLLFVAASIYLVVSDFLSGAGAAAAFGWYSVLAAWQSILTSGTASLSAILYLASQFMPQWRGSIFKSFLVLFKIIWAGVGIIVMFELFQGFLKRRLLLEDPSLFINDAFIFSQIVFAIIILNGFYIGKRIGFGLVQLMKQTPSPAPDKSLAMRIAASGSISIVSWYAFLASYKGLLAVFRLEELIAFYVAMILSMFVINIALEQIRRLIYERPH